ncbi:hypothetical protein [Azonexus hydrophilus]|uniref:hypothetical protein n=1 Tax=Azonexus hydrophilus TaxID=418702 RepID=UPI001965FF16|nr:hypothetical protein [Azonexus hydrophilus]
MTKDELSSELMDARAMVLGCLSLLEETPPEDRSEEEIATWLMLKRVNAILVEAIEVA